MRQTCVRMGRGLCVGACLLLTLAGCRQVASEPPAAPAQPAAAAVYVVLPAYYDQYLDEGLVFESTGEPEDLPVYATVEDAQQAVAAFERQSERSVDAWSVYKLDADWNKDVVPLGKEFRITAPARVEAAVTPPSR